MKLVIRSGIGFALFAGGLTLFAYGLAQAVSMGSCGTDEYGRSVGPPCPSGFAWIVVGMVLGSFVAVAGAALAAAGGARAVLAIVATTVIATGASVALALIDLHEDDTRPGKEVLAAVLVPTALLVVPTLAWAKPKRAATDPFVSERRTAEDEEVDAILRELEDDAPPAETPWRRQAAAEDIAARLRQLEQLKDSGLLGEDEYKTRRTRILEEL